MKNLRKFIDEGNKVKVTLRFRGREMAHQDLGRDLLKRGAAHVAAVLIKLGFRIGERVCLIGGVGDAYAPYLPTDMAIGLTEPRASALEGALELAGRAGRIPPL